MASYLRPAPWQTAARCRKVIVIGLAQSSTDWAGFAKEAGSRERTFAFNDRSWDAQNESNG
jgi:hypothetical protein